VKRALTIATSKFLPRSIKEAHGKTALETVRTFHGNLEGDAAAIAALELAAEAYSRALRSCYAALSSSGDFSRRETAARLGLQYDYVEAAWRQAKGMRDSVKANAERLAGEADGRAANARKTAEKAEGRASKAVKPETVLKWRQKVHHAKRRAHKLALRAETFRNEAAKSAPSVCFGSAKLFNAQHHLAENGFADHAEWRKTWRAARSDTLRAVGQCSKKSGNWAVLCQHTEGDAFVLRIRLPSSCETAHGKYAVFRLRLPYGHRAILDQLSRNAAITWTFKRVDGTWKAYAAITEQTEPRDMLAGAIGVDFNEDHIAIAAIDASGNPLAKVCRTIQLPLYGASGDRAKALMGDAVREIVGLAVERGLPVVIEDLDFGQKKTELRELGKARRARMLSGLSVAMFRQMLVTRAHRHGVRVIVVNPRFTSFLGRLRYERRLGISVHHAAAIEIARRGMGCSVKTKPWAGKPARCGCVAFQVPEWKPGKHVWSWIGSAFAVYRRAHEAHFKALKERRKAAAEQAMVDASIADDRAFLSSA
jgi:IS605 OrfB family transposase